MTNQAKLGYLWRGCRSVGICRDARKGVTVTGQQLHYGRFGKFGKLSPSSALLYKNNPYTFHLRIAIVCFTLSICLSIIWMTFTVVLYKITYTQ